MNEDRADLTSAGPGQLGQGNPENLERLLGRVTGGDKRAFAAVYDQMAGPVYGLACAMTGDAEWSRELAVQALTEVWRTASRYDPSGGSAQSWVMSGARQHVVRQLRAARTTDRTKEGRRIPARPDGPRTGDFGAGPLSVPGLPQGPERQAMALALDGGYTQDEISERLGLAPDTVAELLSAGLLQLAAPHLNGLERGRPAR